MRMIGPDQAANVLERMTITQTIDAGHAIVHVGTDEHGRRVVLVNECSGNTCISTSR